MSVFALAWAKLRKQLGSSVYKLYNVHNVPTHCWKPVQLYCVHTVELNCSPTWKQSSLWAGPEPPAGPEEDN